MKFHMQADEGEGKWRIWWFGSVECPRSWPRWAAGLTIAGLLGGVGLCHYHGEHLHRRWATWNLDRKVEAARLLQSQGRTGEALSGLVSLGLDAVRFRHAPTLTTLAGLAFEDYPREALDLYRQAARMSRLSRKDRAEMALLMVRLGQRTEGIAQLQLLRREDPADKRLERVLLDLQTTVMGLVGALRYEHSSDDASDSRIAELERAVADQQSASEARTALGVLLDRWRGIQPAEMERVARWLLARGQAVLTVRFVSDAAALSRASLLALKIDALMELAAWDEALRLIGHENAPLPEVTRLMLRGLVDCRRPDGNRQAVERSFAQVLRLAKRDRLPGLAAAVAGVALEHDLNALALDAMKQQLAQGFATLDTLERHLVASRRLGRDAADVLADLQSMPGFKDLGSEADLMLCYLKLLVGEDMEWCRRQLTLLRGRIPYAPRLDLLEALAAYREGRCRDAAAMVMVIPSGAASLQDWEVSIAAGILAVEGDRGAFRDRIALADRAPLLAEEHKLLSRWWTAERGRSRPLAEQWRTFAGNPARKVQTGW